MISKDRQRLKKLEMENEHLRAQVEKQSTIIRNNIYEIVELKTALDLIKAALPYTTTD
jgi:flagellar basal body-associated protein FliL